MADFDGPHTPPLPPNSVADRVMRGVASKPEAEAYVSAAEEAKQKSEAQAREELEEQLEKHTIEFLNMTAEQQIRAKALECATRYLCQEIRPSKDSFWATVEDIENYIREGK